MDSSDPLERYMKNNHLTKSKSPEKKTTEQKFLKFNNQNSSNKSRISISKIQPQTKSIIQNINNKPLNSSPKISNKPPKYNPLPKANNSNEAVDKENIQNTE